MVGAPAADEAVAIARRLPTLRVGLHLALVDAPACLPSPDIFRLAGADGVLRSDMARLGSEIFFLNIARRQMRAEVEAQFRAFAATGLKLDHVNAHKHFHLHPSIASTIFDIGPRFAMRALRVPLEPFDIIKAIEPAAASPFRVVMEPWARLLAARARKRGILVPDQVFGLAFTGAMTAERLAALLRRLPEGLSEIYCHPATAGDFRFAVPGARYEDEFTALIAPQARAALSASGALLTGFSG